MKLVPVPCAIYTRKSSEEGLEQGFNSLNAQREACAAYVQSQRSLGWWASPMAYDDGGFSGGNVERPALKRLLADIALKKVQVVVVYKVDRLTRSLADFAKMVELFDAHGVSFVSVTQQFNTTSSMGRLTLNVLLSFAQFEREVTGERIRDKIAASKRKGMWMGGVVPIGYAPKDRTLVIATPQAERVREIFRLYLALGCVSKLQLELQAKGWVTPPRVTRRAGAGGERPFSRGHLYRILSNPIYIGQIPHKDEVHPGNHPAIVPMDLWEQVQARLADKQRRRLASSDAAHPSLLAGFVYGPSGQRLTPSHAQKGPRRYRYYVERPLHEAGRDAAPAGLRIPAHQLEHAVADALIGLLGNPSRLMAHLGDVDAGMARQQLNKAAAIASELKDSTNAMRNLVRRVEVEDDRLRIQVLLGEVLGMDDRDAMTWLEEPVQLRRCGMAVRLIVRAGSATPGQPDPKLIRILARGHDWLARLLSGRSDSIPAIARDEELTTSYVVRTIYTAFLAPDLAQRIARGEQPAGLDAKRLLNSVPLPLSWSDQRRVLGFAD